MKQRTVKIILSSERFGAVTSGLHTCGRHLLVDKNFDKQTLEKFFFQCSDEDRLILHPTTARLAARVMAIAQELRQEQEDNDLAIVIGTESAGKEYFFNEK